jgi:hypothetical protein
LKFTTKNIKKVKKKNAQGFFIFKYAIKSFEKVNFTKNTVMLNFLQRYKGWKFLIFNSETSVKIWNISTEKVISIAEN